MKKNCVIRNEHLDGILCFLARGLRLAMVAGLVSLGGPVLAQAGVTSDPVITLLDGRVTGYPDNVNALPASRQAPPNRWPDLVQAAGIYSLFQKDVHGIVQDLPGSERDLEKVMLTLAGYDGAKLSQAFRAHAVLVAMSTPAFKKGVHKWAHVYNRKTLMSNLRSNSSYALSLPGYAKAVAAVLQSASKGGEKVQLAGSLYKDLAYSLQRKRWAGRVRGGKGLRLAEVRNAPMTPRSLSSALLTPLMQRYSTAHQPVPVSPLTMVAAAQNRINTAIRPIVQSIGPGPAGAATVMANTHRPHLKVAQSHEGEMRDILAIAALRLLDDHARFPAALPARRGPDYFAECVDWARMHLNQCIAATHYVYEDSFCIAEHQLKDPGLCLSGFISAPKLVRVGG